MKRKDFRELINSKQMLRAGSVLLAAVILGVGAWNAGTTVGKDEFVLTSFIDMDDEIVITEDDVPLASAPKVTVKTTTSKKTVTLKSKAKKTYTKTLKPTKKTTTSTKKKETATATTTTTTKKETVTTVTEKYKKNSRKKTVTTTKKVTTTVTTVTTAKASTVSNTAAKTTSSSTAAKNTYSMQISKIAPKVDSRVQKAYQGLGFSVVINGTVSYAGYFDARNQSITLREESDNIYHELGHFVAFVAGNVDTKSDFAAIYKAEKSKFTGTRKTYASQNASEFFAECFREYTLNPSGLKTSCPKTYQAITNALNKITDSQIAQLKAIYGTVWNK